MHMTQIPDHDATRLFLGVLLSGETSERILNDFKFILDYGLQEFLKPLGLFLYRWGIEGSCSLSSELLASRLEGDATFASSGSDYRIGIKCELFRSFLDDPNPGPIISANIHSRIALTFLQVAPHAVSKQWNLYEYVVLLSPCVLLYSGN